MKKIARILSLTLMVCIISSSVPVFTMEAKATNNPYAAWISVFDPIWYTANNAAAASYAKGDVNKLWQYFTKVGIPKGEQASEEFNVYTYAKNYPELVKAFGGNMIQYYIHYATTGKAAGMNAKTLNNEKQQITTTISKADPNAYQYKLSENGKVLLGYNKVEEFIIKYDDRVQFMNMSMEVVDSQDNFGMQYYNNKNGTFNVYGCEIKYSLVSTIETSQGTVEVIKVENVTDHVIGYKGYINANGVIVNIELYDDTDINRLTSMVKALLNK